MAKQHFEKRYQIGRISHQEGFIETAKIIRLWGDIRYIRAFEEIISKYERERNNDKSV